ncbi:TIGR01777 family oxidoreductase [Desulfobacterales bacterium HSG17]|nr:TIGR01777 family oxidoreductase [Desulfobacterales bacterium HSG17]
MKHILITGASGFIGKRLARFFLQKGYKVTGLGTSQKHPFSLKFNKFNWISADTTLEGDWQNCVAASDIIINLTGRNIFRYWTKKYKKSIYDSRILTTRNIVSSLADNPKTQKMLTASAVGIYGDCKEELLTEERLLPGHDFLARVCKEWEKEGLKAKNKDVKVAVMRFGVVLGKGGGALSMMNPTFKLFAGGPLGNGEHWFPWIHIEDLERAVEFIIENSEIEGSFNFTGPEPVRQKQFVRALGQSLHRPSFMPAPSFIIKIIMGELGRSLLQSQKAIPEKLTDSGFNFKFSDVKSALDDICRKTDNYNGNLHDA